MPREDVPYPSRALCSLKCQIDALNNKINELMKSINGVQGDGQGDLSLVSGDAAIVINNDAAQHEVEISLDQSQLPAAAVSSVNGQTGLVDLDSSDIPMVSGVPTPTVNNKIGAIEGNVTQLQLDLAQEVTDRGNADSTLQTNINAANAAITGKVDKLTSAGDHAYTHNGSTQGETAVVDGTTADTIPIRDANGRMQAADPASGATDKTLVTANWVSQTGTGAPNNLLHTTGDERGIGEKYIAVTYSHGLGYLTGRDYTMIMDLGPLGGCNIAFAITGRYGFAIGGFSINSSGVPTFYGNNTYSSERTTLGVGIKDGNMYLCGRRLSSAGQAINLQIFSATKSTTYLNRDPPLTLPTMTMDSYNEGVKF